MSANDLSTYDGDFDNYKTCVDQKTNQIVNILR